MKSYFNILCLVLFIVISTPLCSITIDNGILFPVIISLLDNGHQVIISAKGKSMLPFIEDGDAIVLEKSLKYETGDIVLAHLSSGKYILHRIDSLNDSIVTLMGDGNLQGKEYCPFDSLKAICRAKRDSLENEIALDTEEQKNKAIMWKRCIDYRKDFLSSFNANDENAFWEEIFQYYIIQQRGKISIRPSVSSIKVNNATFMLCSFDSTNVDYSVLITADEKANYVFSKMIGRSFCLHDCVNELMSTYAVDEATCTKDCIDVLTNWFSLGILKVE